MSQGDMSAAGPDDDDFQHAPDLTPDDFPVPGRHRHRHGHDEFVTGRHRRWHPDDRQRLGGHFGGWRPADPGHIRPLADPFGIQLRTEVDPRADLPPVFDQGQLGSCTANATATAFEYDALLDGNFTGTLSRLWIYYQERKLEGVLGRGDTGARGSDAYRIAAEVGIPPESYWPYDITSYGGPPPARAAELENVYRLTKVYCTPPLDKHAFKQVLSNHQTISFGFTVYESFESSSVARSGIVPMPGRDERILGGHEVLAVGYLRSEPEHVLVRNSWGSRQTGRRGWGLNGSGYCLMPWKMILDPAICADWTTIARPIARR